jgi:hypothetical protein
MAAVDVSVVLALVKKALKQNAKGHWGHCVNTYAAAVEAARALRQPAGGAAAHCP